MLSETQTKLNEIQRYIVQEGLEAAIVDGKAEYGSHIEPDERITYYRRHMHARD